MEENQGQACGRAQDFLFLMTGCKSLEPQLWDGVTAVTRVSLRWPGARSTVVAVVSLAKLLGQTPCGSRHQKSQA